MEYHGPSSDRAYGWSFNKTSTPEVQWKILKHVAHQTLDLIHTSLNPPSSCNCSRTSLLPGTGHQREGLTADRIRRREECGKVRLYSIMPLWSFCPVRCPSILTAPRRQPSLFTITRHVLTMVHMWQPSPNGTRSVRASPLRLGGYARPSWCLKGLHIGGSHNFSSRVGLSGPWGSLKGTQGTGTLVGSLAGC